MIRALQRAGMKFKPDVERDFLDMLDESFARTVDRERIKGRPQGIHYNAVVESLKKELK